MATPTRRRRSRLARVQATRASVLTCATALFEERGYLATTMGDIAAAAGVAVQTLYLRFGGKAALLRAAFDVALSGDEEPVAIAERPWVGELRGEPDLERSLRLLAGHARTMLERAVPLFTRIEQAAADPEVAELLLELKQRKLATVGVFAGILRGKSGRHDQVSLQLTTDLLYALSSEELFRLLCVEREWSGGQWETFFVATLLERLGG